VNPGVRAAASNGDHDRSPGCPDRPAASQTVANDINDRGQVVGCYADANGTYHGFRYDKGRFTRIDPPGGADVPRFGTTCPLGINNRSQVVGQYVDAAGLLHGYLWEQGVAFGPSILLGGRATSARRCRTWAGSAEPWPPTSTTAARSCCRPREAATREGRRASRRPSAAEATWRRRPPALATLRPTGPALCSPNVATSINRRAATAEARRRIGYGGEIELGLIAGRG
jgi:probable HAF family extracellular repeat protein